MVNREAIISIVEQMSEKKSAPCKKALQKMVFLIEAKGIDLGCDYGIHFYGPYSSDLDYAVRELYDEKILNIEFTNTEHNISVNDETTSNEYINSDITNIIDTFVHESPSELELITTALFVYLEKDKDKDAISEGVIKIKGSKYPLHRIESAIEKLEATGYIA